MPQLRQNNITREWVVVCPERAKRPTDFMIPKVERTTEKLKCPFCAGTPSYKQNERVHKASNENTFVMENRYPAFIEDEGKVGSRSSYPEKGFYRVRPSVGDHEIIIVKDHDLSIYTMTKEIFTDLFEMIRERYVWMAEHEKVATIIPIYNHGAEAGASISHPHAQIFASGVVANTVERELRGADDYYGINGACVYCDMVAHEVKERRRLVYENEHFVAFAFFASRFPFEVWVLPKAHESEFEKTSKTSMHALSDAMKETFAMLGKTIDNPPLNFYIHTMPVIHKESASYHWHVEIVPRVTSYGGFELGSDVIINVMPPEEAAHYLRQSVATSTVASK